MADKRQFDMLLGGAENLPQEIHIMKLATARASEMAAMTYSLQNPRQTKLIFQKLPMHMRRRVMSHNAKRMPRKLRNSHLSQMAKSGLPPKTKRPSRKYRRRPRNLLLEYNRRQKSKIWLETHIWHAKRFKMIEKWGFKLPNHSNDKCFRANYRAVMNHCLIQDISYFTCLEIRGPMNILKEKLKEHCNQHELTFGAKVYTNGEREGTVMFYKKNGYPYLPIGHVHFLWRPNDSNTKAIWLWIHPSFYSIVLQEIISNFNFQLQERKANLDSESEGSQEKTSAGQEVPDLNIFSTNKIPTYSNAEECQMFVLRNCLNRFRLCGPLTLSIISNAFKLPNVNSKIILAKKDKLLVNTDEVDLEISNAKVTNDQYQMDVDTFNKSEHSIDVWYNIFYQSQDNLEVFQVQKNVYNNLESLKSPSQLPPNMVLALTILDPRFFLPNKRSKTFINSQIGENTPVPPTLANRSPLWDTNIRTYVTKNCISTSEINNLRSQSLVPGVENDQQFNEDIMHKIPILLIQKPGNYSHNIDFGCGIDIVLPAGWSMPFWLALILRCARPGGLREAKSIAFENSDINTPVINHPDTEAYQIEANFEKAKLIEKYFRLPPNKRVNYTKFAISSPFFCEWKLLIKEWNGQSNFYILRDKYILSLLHCKMSADVDKQRKISKKDIVKNELSENLDNLIKDTNCYVPVKVIIKRKGVPKDYSIICLPTQEDIKKYNENKKWSGPVESMKVDSNEEKRKTLKRSHQALLRSLRRQRVRAKKRVEYASSNLPIKNSEEVKHLNKIRHLIKRKFENSNKNIIDQQAQTMANLYLPECTKVRHACDREVIGYVTQGGFSFSQANGVGLGYVIFSSIINLIKEKSDTVLIRNTTTRKYRICKLEIIR